MYHTEPFYHTITEKVFSTPRREDESAKKSKEKVEGKRTLLQSIADEKRKRIGETTEAKKDHTE